MKRAKPKREPKSKGTLIVEQHRPAMNKLTDAERQQRFDQLSAKHQLQIQSYIDGVNAWMTEAAATGKLSEGYAQNQLKAVPFRVTDSVAISDLMSQRFGSGGGAVLICCRPPAAHAAQNSSNPTTTVRRIALRVRFRTSRPHPCRRPRTW